MIGIISYFINLLIIFAKYIQNFDCAILHIVNIPIVAQWLIVVGLLIAVIGMQKRFIFTGLIAIFLGIFISYKQKLPQIFISQEQNLIIARPLNSDIILVSNTIGNKFIRQLFANFVNSKQEKILSPTYKNQKLIEYQLNFFNSEVIIKQILNNNFKSKKYQMTTIINDFTLLSQDDHRNNGGYFIYLQPNDYYVISSRGYEGNRLWNN